MNHNQRENLIVLGFGLLLVVSLIALTEFVSAQTDTAVAVIPAVSFRHNGNHADDSGLLWAYFDNNNNQVLNHIIINRTNTVTPCLMAPVNLPDGATLTEFRATFQNALTYTNFTVDFRRVAFATGQVDILADIVQETVPSTEFTASITDNKLVTPDYGYYATFCLPKNTTSSPLANVFYGARVFYEKP